MLPFVKGATYTATHWKTLEQKPVQYLGTNLWLDGGNVIQAEKYTDFRPLAQGLIEFAELGGYGVRSDRGWEVV